MGVFILRFALLATFAGKIVAASSEQVPLVPQRPFAVPSRPNVIPPQPNTPLTWGDINFLHTTDSHGWLLGHTKETYPEPSFSGTLGDFYSFVHHMKRLAEEKDVDLLLVDSGDIHDGTGLVDGYPPGGIDAHAANQFLKKIPYDVMAIGNHELYKYENALDMHQNFAPAFGDRYLTSNVNITITDGKTGAAQSLPIGQRYRKFKTRKGRKVTAFGILYNFPDMAPNTTLHFVENLVKEPWFVNAIQEEPDLFVLAGHMAVTGDSSSWSIVHQIIRALHPQTPILIFGGHTHIRDCIQFDSRSMAIESGRYWETLGWMSVKLDDTTAGQSSIERRYLDPNRVTYKYHAEVSEDEFDTETGKNITEGLKDLYDEYNLGEVFGVTPQDYYVYRYPYPHNSSLPFHYINVAIPYVLTLNDTRYNSGIPYVAIINSDMVRFDLYKGPFTRNDQFTISPFDNKIVYIGDLPYSIVSKVLGALNRPRTFDGDIDNFEDRKFRRDGSEVRYREWMIEMNRVAAIKGDSSELTPGYVTVDQCPGKGDDVEHSPIPLFDTPTYVATTKLPDQLGAQLGGETLVDLVFVDFLVPRVLRVLNQLLPKGKEATHDDVHVYSPYTSNQVLGVYATAHWK